MSEKTRIKKNEKHWTIQCPNPECLCDDVESIEYIEWYPYYSKLSREEDGSITINTADGEIYYDGGSIDAKLQCSKCGTEWAMPINADDHINWD